LAVEGDSQSYLSALQFYVNNKTSVLQKSRETTQNVIYDNLGEDFGKIVMETIECTTPFFIIEEFINEVIDYIANRSIDLPKLAPPTIFQARQETVNSQVDQMTAQIDKFIDWYSESIKKNIPFYAFFAIYGSFVFLYDVGERIYMKFKKQKEVDLPHTK
jgi:hypothetical protein